MQVNAFHKGSFKVKLLIFLCSLLVSISQSYAADTRIEGIPGGQKFEANPFWLKPLPNQWIIGQVAGIAIDKNDHLWIVQRPTSLAPDELGLANKNAKCCIAAPPVIEFDKNGKVLQAWGGPGQGYDWFENEHGIYIAPNGDVWLAGNGKSDRQLLKFSKEGKFLLQIGSPGLEQNSNDTKNLGRPAHLDLDVAANEIFVADGYQNRRVVVFDSNTGAYKRHWGAYGGKPADGIFERFNTKLDQFGNPVHCARLLKNGQLAVCDRAQNRLQIFTKDGKFVRQLEIDTETRDNKTGWGSVYDVVEDSRSQYFYIADGSNNEIKIVDQKTGQTLGTIGRSGRNAGDFHVLHNIAIDSQGNLYTSEVDNAKRVQKFDRKK
jgi:DNA-binding beta-propeller fold protein YncE